MRSRNIKPGFFKNEILGSADPLYSVVFAGLWCMADRDGRLEDRPLRIHAEINPYRPWASTVQALDWLGNNNFIIRYERDGKKYLSIVNFSSHQQPHHRESKSRIPAPLDQGVIEARENPVLAPEITVLAPLIPDSGFLIPDSPITQSAAVAAARPKKPKSRKSPEVPLPDGFTVDAELEEYAKRLLPEVNVPSLTETFISRAKTKQWRYANWRQAFQTYVRNCAPDSGHWAAGQYPRYQWR